MTTYRVLGEIEVRAGARQLALGGRRQVPLLAFLLLHANRAVASDEIVDALQLSPKALQMAVTRLRRALEPLNQDGEPVLRTVAGGYELVVGPGELDAAVFERRVDDGLRALEYDKPERAGELLRSGLELWRGRALAGVAYEAFAQFEIGRLEELRLKAREACLDTDRRLGRDDGLIPGLYELLADHPTDEQVACPLMLALYRGGRQTDALDVFRGLRERLAELGLAPGRQLQDVQRRILNQDPTLEERLPNELDPAAAPALVGRRGELSRLREHWRQARAGRGAVVAMSGPLGIGKSRLAAELAREAHEQGAIVRYAHGSEAVAEIDAARRATDLTLLVVDDADARALTAVTRLAPELADAPVLALVAGELNGAREALRLRPLDLEAVRALGAAYWPSRDDVPAARLLEASGGVPARVRELAAEWALREAADDVDSAAGDTADARVKLRASETKFAEALGELQTARERAFPSETAGAAVVCPFKGLTAFDAADADYYFGRERLIAELQTRLVGAPLMGIVGPSGSGKSSALRAGLLPALAAGVLPGSETWEQILVRPGEHPPRDLVQRAGARRFVVAVDQFEEVFTACRDNDARDAFVADLMRLARGSDGRGVVVLALRADQYGRCAEYPELSSLLAANHVLVQPMRRDELRSAIERPSERAGLHVEPKLTEALIADVAGEPGALPLLSATLLELWQHRDGRQLRLAAYNEQGGVRGAVARLAEGAFGQLGAAEQAVARDVLMRLVAEGDERAVERRRIALADVETGGRGDVARVLDLLADRRLVTISEGTLEVAHEALLREWPRLAGWIEEDREGLRVQRGLSAAAAEWSRLERDDGALYRGLNLSLALDWRAGHEGSLNRLEREFLDASLAAVRAEETARRRRSRRVLAGLSVALAAISAVAVLAVVQTREAGLQREVSSSRELAAIALSELDTDPGLSLALARHALDRAFTSQAASALRQAVVSYRALTVLPVSQDAVLTADFSPDGRRVVTAALDGQLGVWRLSDASAEAADHPHKALMDARFSPDGRSIATLGADGSVVIAGVTDGRSRLVLEPVGSETAGSLAFSRDGRRLAVVRGGVASLVDLDGGLVRELPVGEQGSFTSGVALSADGRHAAAVNGIDGSIRVWDLTTDGEPVVISGASDSLGRVDFSPDGRRVISGGLSGEISVWSAADGRLLATIHPSYAAISRVRFSPDGHSVLSAGEDGTVRIVELASERVSAVLRGHTGAVLDAGFNADGDQVVSAGVDGTVRTWAVSPALVMRGPITNASLSPSGAQIAAGGVDGTVRVWRVSDGSRQATLDGDGDGAATWARFTPDGTRVIVVDGGGGVRVWRPPAARAVQAYRDHGVAAVNAAAMDAGGHRLVSGGDDDRIVVRDLDAGTPPEVLKAGQGGVNDVAFDPSGQQVLSAGADGTIKLWDPRGKARVLRGHQGAVNTAAFDSAGRRVVSAGIDGSIRVWPLDGAPPVILRGHEGEVASASFSPGGGRIVSAGIDGSIRIWDPRETAPLLTAHVHGGRAQSAAFGANGALILSSGDEGVVRLAPCEACGSLDQVLALAGARAERQLDADERERFLDRP